VTCKECREAMVTDPLLNRLRCADCRSLRWSVFRKRALRVGLIATGGLMAFLLAFHRYRRMCRQKHTSIRGGTARLDGSCPECDRISIYTQRRPIPQHLFRYAL
jgi:Zn finger protein HypA/HybF involved in hydrogenase expression